MDIELFAEIIGISKPIEYDKIALAFYDKKGDLGLYLEYKIVEYFLN